jgi:thiol:disulfide interchange protein DsbD
MDRGKVWTIRGVALAVGLLLGVGVYAVGSRVAAPRGVTKGDATAFLPDTANGEWMPFNIALLDEALKQNRPVVVDWTADWCINCRVLEAAVLEREEMKKTFLARNVLLLRADLSEENPPATALNKKLGGEAIPVLAIFKPGLPTSPVVLRDSYSTTRVTAELTP